MTNMPPPPNFEEESDSYFLSVFNRAVDAQHHIVRIDNWWPVHLRHDRSALVENWVERGFGRLIEEHNSYNEHISHFSISDRGVQHGNELSARFEKRKFVTKAKEHFWPASNALAAWIAAAAALAAAYFSYLGLQR